MSTNIANLRHGTVEDITTLVTESEGERATLEATSPLASGGVWLEWDMHSSALIVLSESWVALGCVSADAASATEGE